MIINDLVEIPLALTKFSSSKLFTDLQSSLPQLSIIFVGLPHFFSLYLIPRFSYI